MFWNTGCFDWAGAGAGSSKVFTLKGLSVLFVFFFAGRNPSKAPYRLSPPAKCQQLPAFLAEGSPKINYRKSWYPYSNLSTGGPSRGVLLDNVVFNHWFQCGAGSCPLLILAFPPEFAAGFACPANKHQMGMGRTETSRGPQGLILEASIWGIYF